MKKIFILFVLVGTAALIVGGYYYQQYQDFLKQSVFNKTTIIEIEKGQSYRKFTDNLLQQHANGQQWQWRMLAKLNPIGQWLKVGEFEINTGLTPLQMMQKIKDNQVINYNFTIVEGTNWRELKQKMLENGVLLHTLADISEKQLLKLLKTDKNSPEGLFMPETYQFVRGDSDVDILQRAHQALQKGLLEQWQQRKENLPYKTPYEMLILASIVEKETSQADERSMIAGVFVRRLQLDMRLQTDPTVIYGMGEDYHGDIRSKDLSTDTAYNTYTRKGLTPTPIAMASIESIAACAHPKEGKALYFVANNRGGHYFSETYEQHQKAVQGYLKGKKL
jgi:UPF0755 protein